MINPYSFAWGCVGVGECPRCYTPAILFVHSYYNTGETRCERCMAHSIERSIYHNNFSEEMREAMLLTQADLPSLSPEKFPIIADTPTCDSCQRIEGGESWRFIEAQVTTGDTGTGRRTIIVHARCTSFCNDCNQTIAHTGNRIGYGSNDWRVSYSDFIDIIRVDGNNRCATCADIYKKENGADDFFWCESCDSEWHENNSGWYNGQRYCESCISDNVYDCDDCGEECWHGSDHYCSGDDDDYENNSPIHNYSYRPSPAFFGKGKYHLGFELEVETRNTSRHEGAELAQAEFGAHAYLKDDGSLNDGFEIVTHPHTLEEYQNNFNWKALSKLKNHGLRSWNTNTCGLHVHVSREAFYGDVRLSYEQRILQRQAHELRFMKLIYDNERQVGRIAGRGSNHYAGFQDKGKLVRKVKQGFQANGRYSAVNTENDATLEVRVFKGSLRPERVLSALEFVTASVEYTRDLPINGKNNALSWLRFTGYVAQHAETYPNLALIMNESFSNDYPLSED